MAEHLFVYGYHALRAMLLNHQQQVKHLFVQSGRADERVDVLTQLALAAKIPISEVARQKLEGMVGERVHQGMVAQCLQLPTYNEVDLEYTVQSTDAPGLWLILDGVQDPHNLGACLRSANAFAVDGVIIPKKRAVGLTPAVRKVACGADVATPLFVVTNLARCLQMLKQAGVWLVGAAADTDMGLRDVDLSVSVGWVLGSEGHGMRRLTQEHCDYLVQIPMQGTVESLNVSVATGVCLYETLRQRQA